MFFEFWQRGRKEYFTALPHLMHLMHLMKRGTKSQITISRSLHLRTGYAEEWELFDILIKLSVDVVTCFCSQPSVIWRSHRSDTAHEFMQALEVSSKQRTCRSHLMLFAPWSLLCCPRLKPLIHTWTNKIYEPVDKDELYKKLANVDAFFDTLKLKPWKSTNSMRFTVNGTLAKFILRDNAVHIHSNATFEIEVMTSILTFFEI